MPTIAVLEGELSNSLNRFENLLIAKAAKDQRRDLLSTLVENPSSSSTQAIPFLSESYVTIKTNLETRSEESTMAEPEVADQQIAVFSQEIQSKATELRNEYEKELAEKQKKEEAAQSEAKNRQLSVGVNVACKIANSATVSPSKNFLKFFSNLITYISNFDHIHNGFTKFMSFLSKTILNGVGDSALSGISAGVLFFVIVNYSYVLYCEIKNKANLIANKLGIKFSGDKLKEPDEIAEQIKQINETIDKIKTTLNSLSPLLPGGDVETIILYQKLRDIYTLDTLQKIDTLKTSAEKQREIIRRKIKLVQTLEYLHTRESLTEWLLSKRKQEEKDKATKMLLELKAIDNIASAGKRAHELERFYNIHEASLSSLVDKSPQAKDAVPRFNTDFSVDWRHSKFEMAARTKPIIGACVSFAGYIPKFFNVLQSAIFYMALFGTAISIGLFSIFLISAIFSIINFAIVMNNTYFRFYRAINGYGTDGQKFHNFIREIYSKDYDQLPRLQKVSAGIKYMWKDNVIGDTINAIGGLGTGLAVSILLLLGASMTNTLGIGLIFFTGFCVFSAVFYFVRYMRKWVDDRRITKLKQAKNDLAAAVNTVNHAHERIKLQSKVFSMEVKAVDLLKSKFTEPRSTNIAAKDRGAAVSYKTELLSTLESARSTAVQIDKEVSRIKSAQAKAKEAQSRIASSKIIKPADLSKSEQDLTKISEKVTQSAESLNTAITQIQGFIPVIAELIAPIPSVPIPPSTLNIPAPSSLPDASASNHHHLQKDAQAPVIHSLPTVFPIPSFFASSNTPNPQVTSRPQSTSASNQKV